MEFFGWLIIVISLGAIGLVMYRWNWCLQSSKVRSLVKVLKEPGARILVIIVGLALIALGFLLVTGWWG
ncbi:MAG: hypothetical protein HN929_14090 [Chloroflexi bacterium]|jgi:uncharacterized membrane protein YwzB|nr:hypothetical protein [Chloroflexota bacterium]MBT7082566.1 hypothetical protein [Chloroflexota bacterium]MBT7289111.1 hypothetical protein [Chloroflexota bacterium]